MLFIIGFFAPFFSNLFFFFSRKYSNTVRWIAGVWSSFYAAAMFHYPSAVDTMDAEQAAQVAADAKMYITVGTLTLASLIVGVFVAWRRGKKEKAGQDR